MSERAESGDIVVANCKNSGGGVKIEFQRGP